MDGLTIVKLLLLGQFQSFCYFRSKVFTILRLNTILNYALKCLIVTCKVKKLLSKRDTSIDNHEDPIHTYKKGTFIKMKFRLGKPHIKKNIKYMVEHYTKYVLNLFSRIFRLLIIGRTP